MRLTFAALAALLLCACTGDAGNCIRLPAGARYCLVQGPWPEFSAEQAATVNFREKSMHLITRVQAGPQGLHFAGLTPLGQTLIQVSWENGALRADMPPALADRLDGTLFPALLQIATWPAEEVRKGLPEGLALMEEVDRRTISDGRQDILTVSWEGKTLPYQRLRFDAPAAGLSIDVRTLDEEESR